MLPLDAINALLTELFSDFLKNKLTVYKIMHDHYFYF